MANINEDIEGFCTEILTAHNTSSTLCGATGPRASQTRRRGQGSQRTPAGKRHPGGERGGQVGVRPGSWMPGPNDITVLQDVKF